MRYPLIVFLIFSTISLIACSSEKTAEKTADCQQLKEEISEKFNDLSIDENNSTFSTVKDVFYSPKTDSCLYQLKNYTVYKNSPGQNGTDYNYELFDYSTSEKLLHSQGCKGERQCDQNNEEAEQSFLEQMKAYE